MSKGGDDAVPECFCGRVFPTSDVLKVGVLRNGFTYGKLFHQLEEIVSELLRYLREIPSDVHQSLSGVVTFTDNG